MFWDCPSYTGIGYSRVPGLETKLQRLCDSIRPLGRILVAFSGGVDSSLVVKIAKQELRDGVLAVTSDAAAVPRDELRQATAIAAELGVRHRIVATHELKNENYAANAVARCYFCKTTLYSELSRIARQEGIFHIANGTNLDDLDDYRPGLRAADEFQIISPLKDAGLNKNDVRALARTLGLPIWDKPASPCLASRIPYGSRVTVEKLSMVEQAETTLKALGIRELRVRHFSETARIEVGARHLALVTKHWDSLRRKFKEIGFANIELVEFRSGSLNDHLQAPVIHASDLP